MTLSCDHPCNFRLTRFFDRGWGELACEYRWDAPGGASLESGVLPALVHCRIYEFTWYSGDAQPSEDGVFVPEMPPFEGWKFRNPTDGRSGPVGFECFSADQGAAWDRHKLNGKFILPQDTRSYTITGIQQYRYHCLLCGTDALLAGPFVIHRVFAPLLNGPAGVWRYSLSKHGYSAWMTLNAEGYVNDSGNIGFGPDWLTLNVAAARALR